MVDDRGLKSLRRRNHSFFFFLLKVFGIVFLCLEFSVPTADATNPCTVSQFWVVHVDGTTSCEDCESCPPGQGLSHECGRKISSNSMVTCVPCQTGISFSSKYDTSSCTPCGDLCSEDQVVLQNCTPTMNVKCDKQCYSKGRYYDYLGSCLQCSKCCGGGQDVIENECKRKLGTASNVICSFHSSVNRCDITTKPSVKETTAIISTSEQPSPHHHTRASSSTTHKISGTIASDGQRSPHPTDQLIIKVGAAVAVIIWLAAGVYYFNLRRRSSSSSSSLWLKRGVQYPAKGTRGSVSVSLNAGSSLKLNHDAERGVQYLAKDAQGSVHLNADKKVAKSDKVKLGAIPTAETSEPLLGSKESAILTCSCQKDAKKGSKLLSSLMEHGSHLRGICMHLDTPVQRCGNIREVAQCYGYNHFEIVSGLEKHPDGPTCALINWLAASHPDLTVREFASVVERETKRNDVIKMLTAYDSVEEKTL